MEVIKPVPLEFTGTMSSAPSDYPAWEVSEAPDYAKTYPGDRVYSDPADGGDGHNYECDTRSYYIRSYTRPENSTSGWKDLGPASGEVSSYDLSVAESAYSPWGYGVAVNSGARRYDYLTRHDYEALVDIAAGDNDLRPSVALASTDDTVAGYWFDVGPANGFAMLDGETDTRTQATTELEATVRAQGLCDRVVFAGLRNVASIAVSVTAAEMIGNPAFVAPPSSSWTKWQAAVSIAHAAPGMTITNSDGAALAYVYLRDFGPFVPGREYIFSATISAGAVGLAVNNALDTTSIAGPTTPISGAGTTSVTWTAADTFGHIYLIIPIGTATTTVTAVSIKETTAGAQALTADLEIGSSGRYRRVVSLPHTAVSWPQYAITLTGAQPATTLEVGLVLAGKAVDCGCTEADVEVGTADYSRRERDEYGTVSYLRRGSSKNFRAIVHIPDSNGEYVAEVMEDVRGEPAFFNFNNTGTDYSRLQVHGFATDFYTLVTGMPGLDTLVVTLEGMVE